MSSSVLLARMKLSQNDLKAAEEILQEAESRTPQSSEVAEIYLVTGQTSKAEPEICRSIQNGQALLALRQSKLRL